MKLTGKITGLVNSYGFILCDRYTATPNGSDVFLHVSNCRDIFHKLKNGTRVSFDVKASPKKPGSLTAFDVKILD